MSVTSCISTFLFHFYLDTRIGNIFFWVSDNTLYIQLVPYIARPIFFCLVFYGSNKYSLYQCQWQYFTKEICLSAPYDPFLMHSLGDMFCLKVIVVRSLNRCQVRTYFVLKYYSTACVDHLLFIRILRSPVLRERKH